MSFCEIHNNNITTSLFFNWGSCHYHTHIAWVIDSPIKVIDIGWSYLAYYFRRRRTCTAFWDAYEYACISISGFAAILCCSVTGLIICVGLHAFWEAGPIWQLSLLVLHWRFLTFDPLEQQNGPSPVGNHTEGCSAEVAPPQKNYAIITCRECWNRSWQRGRRCCRKRRWRL